MGKILVDELSVAFGDGDKAVWALQGVSFTVDDGEFTSVVGPSGCGKTTLLRVLAGAVKPTAGAVSCGGDGEGRGIVFQEDRLLPWRPLIENVAFGLEVRGIDRDERRERAQAYIDMVGLGGFEDRYPYELSGGMRQRVNLARALAIEPAVLLMDEPFASLDSQTREIMQYELLAVWEQTKKTVLFITHQIDEAVYLSDRVIVFSGRPGRFKAEFRIDMPRPRELTVKRTPEFVGIIDKIWKLLESDVRREHGHLGAAASSSA